VTDSDIVLNDLQDAAIEEVAETEPEIPRQRLRILYSKGEAIQFISHQDEFRMWERTLRRADLPLVYKQGFNPQPMMQFAAPLGVGMTGVREYLDVTLAPPVEVGNVKTRLRAALPDAVGLHVVEEIPLKAEALANSLFGADYTVLLDVTPDELSRDEVQRRIDDFWAKSEIWRERERKGERYTYNLRPLVFELSVLDAKAQRREEKQLQELQKQEAQLHLTPNPSPRGEGSTKVSHVSPFSALSATSAVSAIRLFVRVQQRNGATGRPDEVVAALGLDDFPRVLQRERLYFGENPEDVAVFAAYPEVSKEQVAGQKLGRKRKQKPEHAQPRGRNIAERAGDEFV